MCSTISLGKIPPSYWYSCHWIFILTLNTSIDFFILLDFSLIAAGKANTVDGLRLLKSYKQEESYIVWNNVAQQLAKISVIIADKEFYADWQRFKLDLFSVIKVKLQ